MSAYDHYAYLYASIVLCCGAFLPPASISVFAYYKIIKKVGMGDKCENMNRHHDVKYYESDRSIWKIYKRVSMR